MGVLSLTEAAQSSLYDQEQGLCLILIHLINEEGMTHGIWNHSVPSSIGWHSAFLS